METRFSNQQRITNTLLLNASFINNLGLMHGKMGISIFFFHLARETQNKIYEDYAGELIDEIYEEIGTNTTTDFENGLAGIGWGIEYLVQNGFIEADTDEVLEEFDNRIFKELIYQAPNEIGLLNGLLGIGAYYLKRIQNPASNDEKIPTLTNKQTLIHIIDELNNRLQEKEIEELLDCENESKRAKEKIESPKASNSEFFRSSHTFDITWTYPVLIWFLAELYEQNIFNFKVEKIIQRLIEPLITDNNLPKQQSNRLLLALALSKLQQITSNNQTFETLNIQIILINLLNNVNREKIKSELFPNSLIVLNGTAGIVWVYKQLFKQTLDDRYKIEMEYWLTQCAGTGAENDDIQNIESAANNKETIHGILAGNAGLLLSSIKNA